MANRRSFLKMLGISGPAAVAGAALPKMADPAPKVTDCFRFACDCGESIVAPTPKEDKAIVLMPCTRCGNHWELVWHGDHFTVSRIWT